MDYLHYRYKNWQPGEFLNLTFGQKKIARIYMQKELQERLEKNQVILEALGGG